MPITREQWVAALRSGEFKQATGRLYKGWGDGYCCLGVACALAGVPKDRLNGQETSQFFSVDMQELYTQLGVDAELCDSLASANDRGYTFDQIATVIEALPFHRIVDEEGYSALSSDELAAARLKEKEAFDTLPQRASP